jgi:RNA polymerase sigma-70 factor (ECF subfamily)
VRSDSAREDRFEAVARDVFQPLQRYLHRRAAAADAADVFAETLTVIWRRLDDVPAGDPLPWCYGVARRCLANHRRGDARRERLTDRLRTGEPTPMSDDPQDAVERIDPDLQRAITTLSDAERDIVHLWAWERLEPREIALVLDMSTNAVSVALSRAKRKLAAELGTNRQDPAPAGHDTGERTVEHGKESR